jgi:hypothetical protein
MPNLISSIPRVDGKLHTLVKPIANAAKSVSFGDRDPTHRHKCIQQEIQHRVKTLYLFSSTPPINQTALQSKEAAVPSSPSRSMSLKLSRSFKTAGMKNHIMVTPWDSNLMKITYIIRIKDQEQIQKLARYSSRPSKSPPEPANHYHRRANDIQHLCWVACILWP